MNKPPGTHFPQPASPSSIPSLSDSLFAVCISCWIKLLIHQSHPEVIPSLVCFSSLLGNSPAIWLIVKHPNCWTVSCLVTTPCKPDFLLLLYEVSVVAQYCTMLMGSAPGLCLPVSPSVFSCDDIPEGEFCTRCKLDSRDVVT